MNWKPIAIAGALSCLLPFTSAQAGVTIILSNHQQIITRGSNMSLDRMMAARNVYGDRFIWTERGAVSYLITDPATIERVLKLYEPAREDKLAEKALKSKRHELELRERALDKEEEALDDEEERLDDREGDDEDASFEAAHKQIEAKQHALNARRRPIELEERRLDEEEEALDAKRDRAEEIADREVDKIIDEAISQGQAIKAPK